MATKTKEGALKAARKLYGPTAVEGVDFTLRNTGAGWEHEAIPAANEPAKKARATRAPKAPTPRAAKTPKAKGAPADASEVAPEPRSFKPDAPAGETKTEALMGMMRRDGGATSKDMEEATGWAPHSVRGLLGTLRKRGVTIESRKLKGESTIYRIPREPTPEGAVGDVI